MTICLATVHRNARFLPLALLYIKAYLVERLGVAVDAVDIAEFDRDETEDAIVARVLAQAPAVVGLSCYVWNIRLLMAVAARVKARRPDIRVVVGGPEVGPVGAAVLMAHPAVDVVVCSEGELPFAGLIDAWRHGRDLSEVPGIVYRDGDRLVETAESPVLRDLNALPSPHDARYVGAGDGHGRVASIETQRGCVFRCNFCFYNKDLSIRNRRFDLDRVKREILFWLARDIDELFLMDPVFNLYADRAKEICRFIAAHNTRRIGVHAEVWAEFIDDELAALMKAANVVFLEVGLQTTDTGVLATVERRLKVQKFMDGIGHLAAHGLTYELQLIYGLPGETVDSFRRSLDFAARLEPPDLSVFPLMVLPGTELWRKAGPMGLRFSPDPPYFVESHPSMTAEEIAHGFRVVAALGELYGLNTLRLLLREPDVSCSEVVEAWITASAAWPETAPLAERMQGFLEAYCKTKGIPAAFYLGCASVELAAAPVPGPVVA